MDRSGATIYVIQALSQGTNISVTVDGGPATIHTLNPFPSNGFVMNSSIFDIQNLAYGQHALTLDVLDFNLALGGIMFDYAAINDTMPADSPITTPVILTTTSSFSTTSATPLTSSSTSSTVLALSVSATPAPAVTSSVGANSTSALSFRPSWKAPLTTEFSTTHLGAIVAAAVAGAFMLVITLVVCIWHRRRSRRGTAVVLDLTDAESGNFPHSLRRDPFKSLSLSTPIPSIRLSARSQSLPAETIRAATISPFPHGRMPSSTNPTVWSPKHGPSGSISLTSGGPPQAAKNWPDTSMSSTDSGVQVQSPSNKSPGSSAGSSSGAAGLTDEQLDLVTNLRKNNVPAATIARVMERMLAGGLDGEASLPPSYESHA
ncbi:hypothetical protein HWV62_13741 [Athelia sp. TMB]|nr:hypothetical protein HWV62_13741 [Athelia sp. TMB]